MTGAPRKPATKLPHLRKQMQKNQIAQKANKLSTVRRKSSGSGK
ncbi:hypothetical protein [Schlesneria sp. T3-172]